MAEALGVSRQTISNWENNKSYPDIISVIKMSDIYSVSLDHLLKEEKSMKQTIAMVILWQVKGPMTFEWNVVFKWILLPLDLLVTTMFIAKNNYWGKGNWSSVLVAAITYLTVPYTRFIQESGIATYTFRFPNFGYMLIGIIVAVCGICIGSFGNKKDNCS